ncbi:MAG: Wzz/FepE/Etk N-terminal domain-containing protein [Roseiarcus sp.]
MEAEWMRGEGDREPRESAVDLPQLLRAVGRRKWGIIVPTIAAFALAAAVVIFLPPRYVGVAKVLLENQESYYTRPDKAGAEPAPALDAEAVQSEAETILSPDLARQAIARLALSDRPEFNQAAGSGPLSIALSLFGLAGSGGAQSSETRVVDAFLSRLTAFPVSKTRVLQIEFVSEDPELAARAANLVAQLFLAAQEAAKKNSAKAASAWLASKIDELRGKVAESDEKVENFRAQSGLLGVGNNMTASGQQLADLNNQLAAARAAQSESLAKAQLMRSLVRDGRLLDAPDFVKDESLRRYGEQRVALKAQIALESRTLLPGHPRMKELAAELQGLDDEIVVAIDKAARGLENDARLAAAQAASLAAALAAQSKLVASGNVDEVALRALELDAHAARDQLESYVQKYREAIARDADNASPADARIISVASPPRSPTFPKKAETLALGTLAGFLLSTAVVVSRALLSVDPIVRAEGGRPPPLERAADPGTAPERGERAREGPTGDASMEDFTSVEALARHLAAEAEPGAGLLAMIAGDGSDASQTVGLAAARRLSLRGRAILVDLGPPGKQASAGLEADREAAGLDDLIAGAATFAQTIQRDAVSDLDFIPTGAGPIEADGLDQVVEALAAAYDFVVVHAPEWRREPALAVMDGVDALIVVAPARRLRNALAEARAAMGGAARDVIGFIAGEESGRFGRAA